MPETYWYAYDKTGRPTPPYFDTREEAAEAAGEGELVRPVNAAFVESTTLEDTDESEDTSVEEESDGGGGPEPYKQLDHDELKQEAEERGIADETDLRSKDAIIQALREFDERGE